MQKNVAGQVIGAQLVSATDGSAFTGSVTVSVTGDAGTQATGSVGSGACTHEGNGYHTYAPAQAETNYNLVAFTFTGSGAVPVTVQVYTNTPQTGDSFARLGAPAGASVSADIADIPTVSEFNARTLAAADYFDPAADTVANVTTVATTTTNTDMRGTDGAYTGTPPTAASIADAVCDEALSGHTTAGTVGKAISDTLADTNELQGDWTDGGRLDLLLDAILADTGTDGVVLSSSTRDAIATSLLDLSAGVETNRTLRQAMRLILAACVGKISGAGGTSITIRDTNDTVDRIVTTGSDADGNRPSVTLDAS